MLADKTTLTDLSIFHHDEEQSVFHRINYATTIGGKEWLSYLLSHPHKNIEKIKQTQQVLQIIIQQHKKWPTVITNGTLMVVHKLYESTLEEVSAHPNAVNSILYKIINGPDFSLVKYSVNHFSDFFIGLQQLLEVFVDVEVPQMLQELLDRIRYLTRSKEVQALMRWNKKEPHAPARILKLGRMLRHDFKPEALELVDIFSKLDAYYGMAMACTKMGFCFPEVIHSDTPFLQAADLFHPLLAKPVSYDVELDKQHNFMFLTGANMAGKSTFIKAVGVATYLAHVGMGVPAKTFACSLFDGLLSNIQVEDNITRGESYFYNEVQRIKKTISKINDKRNWLILIDELFKGTNVQDAMKCSTSVIEGLRKMPNALFILSTHLYEIGEGLRQFPNIRFNYFETQTANGQLVFSFQLKEGISNDRLGYLILQREGVVDMLRDL